MSSQKHGRPEEELFLNKPTAAQGGQQSTVAPLRIHKQPGTSSTPAPRIPSAGTSSSAFSQPPYPAPTSKLPNPNAPYPYPNDPSRTGTRPQNNLPYPAFDEPPRNTTPESTTSSGRRRRDSNTVPQPSGQRAKFSADDPNRPTLSGYAHNPAKTTSSPQSSLGERRGNLPTPISQPGAPGPGPDSGTQDLFQRPPQRKDGQPEQGQRKGSAAPNPFPEFHQQYWPPPSADGPSQAPKPGGLTPPEPGNGIGRTDSTASVMTTRATRGSPPPPETPILEPPGGSIEARYAAAGIGAAPSAAATQRQAQYPATRQGMNSTLPVATQQGQQPPRRPWTPTEPAGTQPHGPPVSFQGMNEVTVPDSVPIAGSFGQIQGQPQQPSGPTAVRPGAEALEQDFNRLNVDEPPPAYSSVQQNQNRSGSGHPNEKGGPSGGIAQPTAMAAGAAAGAGMSAAASSQGHPAFANDPRHQPGATPSPAHQGGAVQPQNTGSPAPSVRPASPPPLPEGWIAHLDPNSGQYYYIHLPSQSTQWEFPKGPTPLNLNEPLSPTGTIVNPFSSPAASTFSKQPLASPGFPVPQTATFRPDAYMSMASVATPTAAGFTGPPPTAGVDVYKVAPTNGVYFGPYLRYTNMDIERGVWLGSILLVTDASQPPTIHIHQSVDLSPNPRQLKANPIYSHQRWMFYRYDVDLKMEEQGVKWTYAITSHLGCTRYEFLVAGRYETSWRFIAHSGNDFALNVNANERAKLGGVGFMWKDILQKHIECNGFHAQLGLGDQIYADRMWKEIPLLKQWTATSGKETRKNAAWTPRHEEEISHAYFHYYTSHFDQPHLREAFAQIPHVLTLDDHDIFDGYGSYPEYMQFSNMFKNIGRIGVEMYLLFQHHTTLDILRNVNNDLDLFTITGTGWHFIKYLGPAVVVVGPDCRSERNPHQVMAGPTYQGLFPKVAVLPPSVQHCIWMVPVPLVYPRMESMESLVSTVQTGKKAVTGTFNMLGKVTAGVAGVVGAKGMVGSGFDQAKKAVGKSGLMSSVLSPFGEVSLVDELRDQWTHESKDLERTYFIRTLQGIAHNKSLRMTFFGGDVGSCGAGLVHDPAHPQDHKTMYQIIASPVVNAPPAGYVLRLLHSNKQLYVPANGHRSTNHPSDTKEDMMEIFAQDVNGQPRELKRLMARRNYVACVAFDPEVVQGAFGQTVTPGSGGGKLSLAVDFMVQGDGTYGGAVKYGPVIVPSVEYGR
ncbi:ww domain [Venturia nashicola]|nr:ww domain [Venturia nashicola]